MRWLFFRCPWPTNSWGLFHINQTIPVSKDNAFLTDLPLSGGLFQLITLTRTTTHCVTPRTTRHKTTTVIITCQCRGIWATGELESRRSWGRSWGRSRGRSHGGRWRRVVVRIDHLSHIATDARSALAVDLVGEAGVVEAVIGAKIDVSIASRPRGVELATRLRGRTRVIAREASKHHSPVVGAAFIGNICPYVRRFV